jgi:predicted TPR repeat methyltransferase
VAPDLFADAMATELAGELDRAAKLYAALVRAEPEHAEALHRLGLLEHQRGRCEQAVALLGRAIACEPRRAQYHLSLAAARHARAEPDLAASSCRRALELEPGLGAAELLLGLLSAADGDLAKAEARYRRAAELDPALREAHCNLGAMLERQGRVVEAIAAYRRALAVDPGYRKALGNLANACYRQHAWDEALEHYRRLLELDPGSGIAQHMSAALGGTTPRGCPPDYVRGLFDACAQSFEGCLLGELRYATPEHLRQLLAEVAGPDRRFAYAIDLGCGTGLAGRALRSRCQRLVGVDLSPKMIAQAEQSGQYDELAVGEQLGFLARASPGWDLVLGADVLPYSGDLADLFAAVARGAAAGALFAFSTEASAEGDYLLGRTGRYAHHPRYVERLGAGHGLALRASARRTLRLEGGLPVVGDVFVLQACF